MGKRRGKVSECLTGKLALCLIHLHSVIVCYSLAVLWAVTSFEHFLSGHLGLEAVGAKEVTNGGDVAKGKGIVPRNATTKG